MTHALVRNCAPAFAGGDSHLLAPYKIAATCLVAERNLYALDSVLPELKRADKAALEKAMQGHILAQAVLIGTYQKRR